MVVPSTARDSLTGQSPFSTNSMYLHTVVTPGAWPPRSRIEGRLHDSTVSGFARILEECSWDLDGSFTATLHMGLDVTSSHSFLRSASCHSSSDGITVCPSLVKLWSGAILLVEPLRLFPPE